MTAVYEAHSAAFARVSAAVITDRAGEMVAKIAFKYPRNGGGRVSCYLHVIGVPMVRGIATGFGYDKTSAAASRAASRLAIPADHPVTNEFREMVADIRGALIPDEGSTWDRELREAGFNVLTAI